MTWRWPVESMRAGCATAAIPACFHNSLSVEPTVAPKAISAPKRPTTAWLLRNWIRSLPERELNPILLKELRQATRSWFFIGTLLLFLVALFLISVFFLTRTELLGEQDRQIGLPVLRVFVLLLSVISVLFVPLYTGVRLALERRQSDFDLMFVTPLSPKRIVRGKLSCGAYLLTLFFSVCVPFMSLTHLMRGVDFPSIVLIVGCLYTMACLATQFAILLGSLPVPWPMKVFAGAFYSCALCALCGGLNLFFSRQLVNGVKMTLPFWSGFAVLIFLMLGGIRLFYGMSADLIRNDTRPRGYFNELIRTEQPDAAQNL
jgi:hypothetical protein